jgi:Zn-dependent protease
MNWQSILEMLNILPGIIIGLTVHEFCHALTADKLGDDTAREQGRLSLNPLKHIDPIGFLFIVFAKFGWAKPVQFNPEKLRHPRRDKAIIAAAGPLSNLVLALVLIALVNGWIALLPYAFTSGKENIVMHFLSSDFFVGFITIIYFAIIINLGLFVFNLLPIPPLDGSHIVFSGLNISPETERRIMKIGAPLLFIILIFQNRTGITILPIGELSSAILRFFIPQTG